MTAIATLGSHCSLQVLKGAKDEGLTTILVCEKTAIPFEIIATIFSLLVSVMKSMRNIGNLM